MANLQGTNRQVINEIDFKSSIKTFSQVFSLDFESTSPLLDQFEFLIQVCCGISAYENGEGTRFGRKFHVEAVKL